MRDQFGRKIDYLRISVTPRCNLRCIYCSTANPSEADLANSDCDERMTPEEIRFVTQTFAGLGVEKVRITGGEPLTRSDLAEIITGVSELRGVNDISMTTNGIGLAHKAQKLKDAGLKRVNISIDSLDRDQFKKITDGGDLFKVLEGVCKAVEVGLSPVRLNVVTMKGINDHEIDSFIELTRNNPIDVRFIELMPIGNFVAEHPNSVLLNSEILARRPDLKAISDNGSKPAVYYRVPGYCGRVGLISPISHKFCANCNRIRVTHDGKLRLCLGSNMEVDFLPVLRHKPEQMRELIEKAILQKPAGHCFADNFVSRRNMTVIGG